MIVQVCFQVKDSEHNAYVKGKLKELKSCLKDSDVVVSCHLPKHVVKDKGWSTEMCDALVDIFGEQYACQVKADSFNEAMSKLIEFRAKTARKADKIFVIGEQSIANIALEVELFTHGKIQFL